jgi:hypothetical protein
MPTADAGDARVNLALNVFRSFQTGPGEGLPSNVLVVNAQRAGKKIGDLKAGLEIGVQRRWFSIGEDGFVTLTDAGFDQI